MKQALLKYVLLVSFVMGGCMLVDHYGIPEILEKEAFGPLKSLYDDIQYVLKVPVVNFIFRTLALYEPFLEMAWSEVRPNCLTIEGKRAADALRHPKLTLEVPTINWSSYYNKQSLDVIRGLVEVFSIVNPKLLLIASAWSEAFANRPNQGKDQIIGTINPGVPAHLPKMRLMEVSEAPPSTRRLMLDIAEKHQTLDVASDFRALAQYPQFLGISWSLLKPYVGSPEYTLINQQLKTQAIEFTKHLPYPVTLNRDQLETLYSPREIAGIMCVVSQFQNFIPGLIIDVEYLRKLLLANDH